MSREEKIGFLRALKTATMVCREVVNKEINFKVSPEAKQELVLLIEKDNLSIADLIEEIMTAIDNQIGKTVVEV